MRLVIRAACLPLAATLAWGASAWAGECGDAAREVGERHALGAVRPLETSRAAAAPSPTADAATSSGDTGGDAVPNTGGVRTTRNNAPAVLTEEQRTAVRSAVEAAMRADEAGDGTTCAARLAEARRVEGGSSGEPKAR